ncbi:2-keto-4-pentenoate hydratase [Acidisoma sp.]|uniref:2-keto-4-pentenoate hydratase n=1 Tax=Acidisoma sp. TaxID=1872115 RepID=UPI003B0054D2
MTELLKPDGLTERLLHARRNGLAISVTPEDVPATEQEAYAVQRAVAETLGPVGGWKVGAGGPGAAPSAAPLPASVIMTAPATLPPQYSNRLIEAEIAFRIARDLPPRDAAYTRDEVLEAIGSCHPVIEVVQWRIRDHRAAPPNLKLADHSGHGALVVGEPVPGWRAIDFAGLRVTQEIAGQATKHGIGNPAGDMIRLIAWLADEGAVWAGGLKAGQIVTCGSWTGMTEAAADAPVVVSFAGFTPLTLSFQSS